MRNPWMSLSLHHLLLAAVTLLLLAMTIFGQDDNSDDARYGGQSVDVVFPVRVHFNLTMLVSAADIESASVVIDGRGSTDVDLGELEGDDNVDLSTYWDVPANNVPGFNTSLDYAWQVTLTDGSSLQFSDSFTYAPDTTVWARSDDPDRRLSLITPGGTGDYLRGQLAPVYAFLLSQGQSEPHFRLALSPDGTPINPCNPDSSDEPGVTDPITGESLTCDNRAENSLARINYEILNFSGDPVKAIVPRMVTEFFSSRWEGVEIPAWFERGLGQFFIPDGNRLDVEEVRSMTRSDKLFTLEEMNTLPVDSTTARAWLAQSHMMVRYMVSQAGIQGVFLLGRTAGQDDETFAQSYERAIGQSLDALIPSLEIWIFRQQAEQSMTIDVYAGPTEIPPDTPTPSPFPPTRGPTNTPTITQTPRPTLPPTSTRQPTDTPTPTRRS